MKRVFAVLSFAAVSAALATSANASMRITEWAYSAAPGEFVEFTNVGAAPIDMTGWSYDDDSNLAGTFDLSGFGVVQPGESVVITEVTDSEFRTSWGLAASVKVLGGYTNNLGRNDQINLYDATNTLVDRLTYGDQSFPGSIRTQDRSGVPLTLAALGANSPSQWGFADTVVGGGPYAIGFSTNDEGATGNPGFFVPEPASLALLAMGGLAMLRRRTAR